jgi:hypothetical protein
VYCLQKNVLLAFVVEGGWSWFAYWATLERETVAGEWLAARVHPYIYAKMALHLMEKERKELLAAQERMRSWSSSNQETTEPYLASISADRS